MEIRAVMSTAKPRHNSSLSTFLAVSCTDHIGTRRIKPVSWRVLSSYLSMTIQKFAETVAGDGLQGGQKKRFESLKGQYWHNCSKQWLGAGFTGNGWKKVVKSSFAARVTCNTTTCT
jgi:hypothetical protein